MILRDLVKIELVLPLTDSLGEVNCQAELVVASEANMGVPYEGIISIKRVKDCIASCEHN